MLQKIVIKCSYSGGTKASYNWGSLMHGALIELLPKEISDELHESNLRPFSQYIVPLSPNEVEWHIGVWDDIILEPITRAVMSITKVDVKHKNIVLDVMDANRTVISERDYLAKFFTNEEPCRRYNIEFLTPSTHKSDGEYVLFPSVDLIMQSLYMRFCAFAKDYSIDDEEALKQICQHSRIAYYSLRSTRYHIKGIKIMGYMGRITIAVHGPDQLPRLAGLLLSFAEYAGIGIKTSLGMGACKVEQVRRSSKDKEAAQNE